MIFFELIGSIAIRLRALHTGDHCDLWQYFQKALGFTPHSPLPTPHSSINCLEQRAFDVASLRNREDLRMINGLAPELSKGDATP